MSNGSPGDEVLPQTTLAEAALSREQRALLAKWMSDARLIADLSWRQTDTLVLHVRGAARLETLVRLVREEALQALPGRDLILARLVEVLLIEALRSALGS